MPPVDGRLFLGEEIDPATHQRTGTPVALDPASLTTHGVIVGMTGSGKTGLGIVLLEEALLAGVPTLVIDPKGDLGNLLLTFPDLAPDDFAPWVEAAPGQAADPAGQAAAWRAGLASWGIGPERIAELRRRAAFTIYTPGSTAGVPLNLVGGLGTVTAGGAPLPPEEAAEQIDAAVSGLLGMVGVRSDPLSGREHILLANLVMAAGAAGTPLDLATLVAQVQAPPFRKLGVLDLDTFFPPDDRRDLALKLNALLASPAFAAWNRGDPLDVGAMLTAPDGRPRAAVVSIAHLGDDERQFVVALLLARLTGWMRRQSGTSQLRALVYIDEVFGLAPPNGMPPAKQPILTILKQARAFGVGMVLATQNPVDLDYKAIANAGTWMVGRLQTEQDKARLADGMTAAAGGDPAAIGAAIGALAKREFVLHRASSDAHPVFTSRWSMSYLRGPLTREQIRRLTAPDFAEPSIPASPAPEATPPAPPPAPPVAPAGAPAPVAAAAPLAPAAPPSATTAPAPADDETPVAPAVATGVRSVHLDPAAPWAAAVGAVPGGSRLQAAVGFSVSLHFDDRAAGLDLTEPWEAVLTSLAPPFDAAHLVAVDHDPRDFRAGAPPGARYVIPPVDLGRAAWFNALRADVAAHLQGQRQVTVLRNRALKLVSRPGESPEDFAGRCAQAADAAADAEAAKVRDRLTARIDRLHDAVARAQDRVESAETAARAARTNEVVGIAGSVLGNLLGGRRSVRGMAGDVRGAASRRGQSQRAGQRIDEARHRVDEKVDDLAELEQELADTLVAIDDRWAAVAAEVEPVAVGLEKSDVRIDDVFVVWIPVG